MKPKTYSYDQHSSSPASRERDRLRGLIGLHGVALNLLSPLGYIMIAGRQEIALCETIPIQASARVRVVDVKMNELVVVLAHEQAMHSNTI